MAYEDESGVVGAGGVSGYGAGGAGGGGGRGGGAEGEGGAYEFEDPAAVARETLADESATEEEKGLAAQIILGAAGGEAGAISDMATGRKGRLGQAALFGSFVPGLNLVAAPVAGGYIAGRSLEGAINAVPGPSPAPYAPPPESPVTPEEAAAAEAAAPRPQGPGAPDPPKVPGVGSYTGKLAALGQRAEDVGAKTAEGIREGYEEVVSGMDEQNRAQSEIARLESQGMLNASSVLDSKRALLEQQINEDRQRRIEFAAKKAKTMEAYDLAVEAQRYPQLSMQDVAGFVDKRQQHTDLAETLRDMKRGGVELSADEESQLKMSEAEVRAIDAKLDKASKIRGEWDFDKPNEVFAAIASVFAVGLGAFGAAMRGGENAVLKMAQARAARVLQQQKDEIARRGSMAQGYLNELDMYRDQFGDEQSAADLILARELETFNTVLEGMKLQSDSEVVKRKSDELIAANNQKKGELRIGVEQRMGEAEAKAVSEQTDIAKTEASLKQARDIANAKMASDAIIEQYKQLAANKDLQLPGTIWDGRANSAKSHEKAADFAAAHGIAVKQAELLKKVAPTVLNNPAGFFDFGGNAMTDEARAAKQVWSNLINSLKTMQGMGANFTLMEKELLEFQIGDDPTSLFINYGPLIRDLVKDLDMQANERMSSYGFTRRGAVPEARRQ